MDNETILVARLLAALAAGSFIGMERTTKAMGRVSAHMHWSVPLRAC